MADGRRVAVVIADVQGTFDQRTTMAGNAFLVALTSLISSCQIYNVSQLIDDLVIQVNNVVVQSFPPPLPAC